MSSRTVTSIPATDRNGDADQASAVALSRIQNARPTFIHVLASLRGVARSIRMYYADPGQLRRMQRFYASLLRSGDLAFDVGAHVGSRTLVWARMGVRVVAIEPVPHAMAVLRTLYGHHPRVTLVEAAVGREPGRLPMLVSAREPTVSTLSSDWADRMLRDRGAFARTRWERSVLVPVTTLDSLIARYGRPAFCKIDVEGYDSAVLQGLSEPLQALSFEYVPPALDLVLACVERLNALGLYEFNWSPGESMQWCWPEWVDHSTLERYLHDYPAQGSPGDIYARLQATGRPSRPLAGT
jgi:FkbM family methyltransferase